MVLGGSSLGVVLSMVCPAALVDMAAFLNVLPLVSITSPRLSMSNRVRKILIKFTVLLNSSIANRPLGGMQKGCGFWVLILL